MIHPFQIFLEEFVSLFKKKYIQLNKASWLLETTGSLDAADLKSEIDAELRILLSDPKVYHQLVHWEKSGEISDPLLKRQLNVLIRAFKQNQVDPEMLEKMARKEAALAQSYARFRPELDGKKVSENEIREILKKEIDVEKRKKAWDASKKIGMAIAPQILELVHLRNQVAQNLGYSDYFQMQLDLQEVDGKWLLELFDHVAKRSDKAYLDILREIEQNKAAQFGVDVGELGPWSFSEPFCQEDPIDSSELDELLDGVDIIQSASSFYDRLGIDVRPVLARSDMFEREGKNQHAFCMNVDRMGDVRTLNNVQSSLKWLETVLHEYGHAIYDLGVDPNLPWLLKEPPHMITTEAMALLAGRQAYLEQTLPILVGSLPHLEPLIKKAHRSLKRRQLIFSRWVLVMTAFESELYRNPNQDLNRLWWALVEKYQKMKAPKNRETCADWAAKYHIGLAPVYYFSYLIGEMFASSIQEALSKTQGSSFLARREAGMFLQEKLFRPGNQMPWNELVRHVTGEYLSPDDWLKEFA